MTRRTQSLRSSGPWVVLLALIGMWLGHSAEVVLVSPHHGLAGELWEPADMLPMGAVLALLATVAGARLWWLWLRMSRRLDVARQHLRELWRNRPVSAGRPRPHADIPSASGGTLALWLPLFAMELGLYVVQENLEALLDGGAAPGLRVLAGIHRAAPLVHAAVSLALAWAATAVVRRLRHGQDAVRRAERLVARGVEVVRRSLSTPVPPAPFLRPPLRLHGHVLWCRPPPATVAV